MFDCCFGCPVWERVFAACEECSNSELASPAPLCSVHDAGSKANFAEFYRPDGRSFDSLDRYSDQN